MRWLSCIAALAAVVNQVAGQDIPTPTNRTDDANVAGLSNAILTVSNNATAGEWTLLLATPPQPLNRTASTLFNVNTANLTASPTNALLMVSCDPSSYPGSLTLAGTLGLLAQSHPTAIIFYSLSSAFCNPPRNSSSVPWFSVLNSGSNNGATLLTQANSSPPVVIVAGNASVPNTNPGNGNDPGPYAWVSGTATTAVAMIILYSITGIITALFLLIIVTGAVRAHRHPERYGLRNAVGQPRQSRARGIARAMLETLPIVKFGDTQPQPKTVDVELQAADQHSTVPTKDAPPSTSTASDPQPTAPPPAAAAAAAPAANEEDPMCSICTEEFERGQDTRVLPCRHKFHPACVDPWLLDVSGTCPLCRMDLRDQDSGASTDEQQQQQQQQQPANGLAPPLDPAAPGGPASTSGGRLHALLRRLQPTTAEERIQALRRFREENMHDATAAAEHETRWQRARRRMRL